MHRLSIAWLPILAACQPDTHGGSRNSPPSIEASLPATAPGARDLEAVIEVSDPDGDRLEAHFDWSVDGQHADFHGQILPASALEVGQSWTLIATVDDGSRTAQSTTTTTIDRIGGNVLILLVDDLGIDQIEAYGVRASGPPTPNIDALAAEGVLFRSAWSNPTCSPSRASLLTGRHSRRTGIGKWIYPKNEDFDLDPGEVILPEILPYAAEPYADSMVGKWHVSGYDRDDPYDDPGMVPLETGFSWHAGSIGNPDNSYLITEEVKGYSYWEKATNGLLAFEQGYLTEVTTDDALDRIEAMPEPWLLYLAYNAPHGPLHQPPAHLHDVDFSADTSDQNMYQAMCQALDTELGRLFASIDPDELARTTVIFASDNGTPEWGIVPPMDPERRKGTLFEGGVNVPFIVTGPAVRHPGTESEALIHFVDVWATVAELVGANPSDVLDPRTGTTVETDSRSFLGQVTDPNSPSERDILYTHQHSPNGPPEEWTSYSDTVRDAQYKIVHNSGDEFSFFEFEAPYFEGPDLLAEGPLTADRQAAFDRLSLELTGFEDDLLFGP